MAPHRKMSSQIRMLAFFFPPPKVFIAHNPYCTYKLEMTKVSREFMTSEMSISFVISSPLPSSNPAWQINNILIKAVYRLSSSSVPSLLWHLLVHFIHL